LLKNIKEIKMSKEFNKYMKFGLTRAEYAEAFDGGNLNNPKPSTARMIRDSMLPKFECAMSELCQQYGYTPTDLDFECAIYCLAGQGRRGTFGYNVRKHVDVLRKRGRKAHVFTKS